jgi:hypothetical protein
MQGLLDRGSRNIGTALRIQVYNLLVRKTGQDLSHACATDFKDFGESFFDQLCTGMQTMLQDGDVNLFIHFVLRIFTL